MAWTTETYAGQWAYGADGVLKTALFELCRAVNERQAAIGMAKTSFYKADGSDDTDLVLSDFTGMFTTGPSNYFGINCQSIMAAIKAMAPNFTVSSGISTAYTVSSLQTAVGLGTFLDAPTKPTQALFFQQCHDALDLLIHAVRGGTFNYALGLTVDFRQNNVADTDREVVWDSSAGDTPTHPGVASATCIFEYSLGPGGIYSFCNIYNNYEFAAINLSAYSGVLTGAQYSGRTQSPSGYDGGGSMTAYVGSTSFAATVAGGVTTNQTLTADESELTIGTNNGLVVTCDIPATCPLDALVSSGDSARVEFLPTAWAVYFDIAGELTDQA